MEFALFLKEEGKEWWRVLPSQDDGTKGKKGSQKE
jgi:hypothetical protein